MIACKARRHAAHNPLAVFRDPLSVEQVLASPRLYGPLTRLQCCPPTCGAAAAILCSQNFARCNGLSDQVQIVAQSCTTDRPDSFAGSDLADLQVSGRFRVNEPRLLAPRLARMFGLRVAASRGVIRLVRA